MDDFGSPQEKVNSAISHTNPVNLKPKRKVGMVGRLDVDNYESTITKEEYERCRNSRRSNSLLAECKS